MFALSACAVRTWLNKTRACEWEQGSEHAPAPPSPIRSIFAIAGTCYHEIFVGVRAFGACGACSDEGCSAAMVADQVHARIS